ncbi:MAG: nuclear transport factor 2 family protein [Candidatus Heimdallarchaeota archaeon]
MSDGERGNIIQSLEIFLEGLRVLDFEKISEIFYDRGISCGVAKYEIKHTYLNHWRDMRERMLLMGEDIVSEVMNYSIRSIDVIGNAASVIIDLEFGTKEKITERYIDFYHMLKVKDKWIITSKIFPTNIK